MKTLVANNVRMLIKMANEQSIKREDIVTILKDNEQFVLIYF